MLTLLMIRKSILKTIFGLTLANKKFVLKNLSFSSLFDMEKIKTIISYISRVVPFIF